MNTCFIISKHLHMCILLTINSNILSNHYIQYYVMKNSSSKTVPVKASDRGLSRFKL